MAIYSACPFTGPVLGPIMASFINQALHWRWTWYISTIWSFVELVLVIVFVPETYAPALLKKKAKRLRKETGKDQLRSRREIEEKRMGMSKTKHVIMSIGRPFGEGVLHFSTHSLTKTSQVTEILIKEPMAFALCLWCALLLGILYAFFSSYPIIFARKGFDEGEIGLAFLPMGVGIGIATVLNATYWTRSYTATSQRLGRKPPPEEHLKKAMVAAVMGPISLFWFAWSSQPRIHWAVPLVNYRLSFEKIFFWLTRSMYIYIYIYTTNRWHLFSSELPFNSALLLHLHTKSMLIVLTLRVLWVPIASCVHPLQPPFLSLQSRW